MRKVNITEEAFSKLKGLMLEGDEMNIALGNGKSFDSVVSTMAESFGFNVDESNGYEAVMSDEYMTVKVVYDTSYNEVYMKEINVNFYNSNPSALTHVRRTFDALMEFVSNSDNVGL